MTDLPSPPKIVITIDPDLMDLIPGFLSNRRNEVESMRAAVMHNDLAEVLRISHIVKGVSGGYGFFEMGQIGAAIHTAAQAADSQAAATAIEALAAHLAAIEVSP